MSVDSEALDHLFKSYKIRWYRCPIERSALHELMRSSDLQGWVQALGHLVLAGCTGALTYFFFEAEIWVGFALALLAHGTVASRVRPVTPTFFTPATSSATVPCSGPSG